MKLYTKAGDEGMTSLLSGERVSKNDKRICLTGTLDELSSYLGLVKTKLPEGDGKQFDKQFIEEIQKSLMTVMAHCEDSGNEKHLLNEAEVLKLEKETDRLSQFLPKEFSFVLPGENELSAHIHIARTIARRAERVMTGLNEEQKICRAVRQYINRLSDYLYALSRFYGDKP